MARTPIAVAGVTSTATLAADHCADTLPTTSGRLTRPDSTPWTCPRIGSGRDIGPALGAQTLITADNPDRLRSSASFAARCSTAPIQVWLVPGQVPQRGNSPRL